MKTQVTLSADSHTKGAVGKHLYTDEFAGRAFYLLLFYSLADFLYLIQV